MTRRDSHEYAAGLPAEPRPRAFAKGDRVKVIATGAHATVTYAVETHRGHFVTILPDGESRRRTRVVHARELARIESLF